MDCSNKRRVDIHRVNNTAEGHICKSNMKQESIQNHITRGQHAPKATQATSTCGTMHKIRERETGDVQTRSKEYRPE